MVSVKRVNQKPVPGRSVEIISKVIDKYGKVTRALLIYSIGQENQWHQEPVLRMNLLTGHPSNGTYLGMIPAKYNNLGISVKYRVYFRDDLNYSYTSNEQKYSVSYNLDRPTISSFYFFPSRADPINSVTASVDVTDEGSGVKNVTLVYSALKTQPTPPYITQFASEIPVNMTLNKEDLLEGSNGEYKAIIGKFPENSIVSCRVIAYNFAGIKNEQSCKYTVFPLNEGKVIVRLEVSKVDLGNLTAEAKLSIHGYLPSYQSFRSPFEMVAITDNNKPVQDFTIPLLNETGPFNRTIVQGRFDRTYCPGTI